MDSKINVFGFHGISLYDKGNGQAVGDCPFCGKEKHFYVKTGTGQWDCKVCGEKGNVYTFLDKIHSLFFDSTRPSHFKEISSLRGGIPSSAYKAHGVAFTGSHWMIPITNEQGSVVNLAIWEGKGKPTLATDGCKLHLYGLPQLLEEDRKNEPVIICEGYWDTIALEWMREKVGAGFIIVGTPGASVFKKEWLHHLDGREIFFAFDNDNAGYNGMDRVADMIGARKKNFNKGPKKVSTIRWPSSYSDGFDMNDFVASHLKTPKKGWSLLQKMFVSPGSKSESREVEEKPKKKIPPPKYESLLKEYRKNLHLDKSMEDCLAVMLGVALSIQVPEDPIWLFIVGPPGAGKTLLLRSMERSGACIFKSSLTPASLVSGYASSEGDPSLIPQLIGKCLVLKDYTEIKGKSLSEQEELYAILRGAYDGRVEKTFGNGVSRVYPDPDDPTQKSCHFAMVAGVTHVIHGDTRASLGERFLKLEFLGKDHKPEAHIRAALDGVSEIKGETRIKEMVTAFLDRQLDVKKLPAVPEWVKKRIISLTQLIAIMRATVERERGGEMVYRPQVEIGTRLAKQLIKLGQMLAVVYGKKVIDKKCYRLMERVAFDTGIGWNLDIIRVLIEKSPRYVECSELAIECSVSNSAMQNKLNDLIALGAAERSYIDEKGRKTKKNTGRKGRPTYGYHVSANLLRLWKVAKVGEAK